MTPTSTTTITFAADRERIGPVAAGHRNLLRAIRLSPDPAHLNLTTVFDLPEGATLDDLGEVVRTLLVRHESLRTTYSFDPDSEPTQRVLAAGELTVAVHEVEHDAATAAADIGRALRAASFDLTAELPMRVAVVTTAGVPRYAAVVICHSAADATAWELLVREWDELIRGGRLAETNEPQPVDLVAMERRPAIKRVMAASLQYWESQLRAIPQATFPVSVPVLDPPVFAGLHIRSLTAAHALGRISARTGAARSSIVLATMALLIHHRSQQQTCVVTSLSANRILSELRGFVGTLAQDALVPIDLSVVTSFDDALQRVRTAALRAYRHSWFDATALWHIIEETGNIRGTAFARDCVFNDMSSLVRVPGDEVSAGVALQRYPGVRMTTGEPPVEIVDAQLDAEFSWLRPEWMASPFTLYAHQLEDRLELALWASPHVLSRAESVEFGRAIVRVLMEAGDRDVSMDELPSLIDFPPMRRGPEWRLIDSCWIDLAAVRALVRDALPGRAAAVHLMPSPQQGERLVCHVADPKLTPAEIHAACMAALPGRVTAMAPHTYVVCEDAPDDVDSVAAWRAQSVRLEGSGRDVRTLEAVGHGAACR